MLISYEINRTSAEHWLKKMENSLISVTSVE